MPYDETVISDILTRLEALEAGQVGAAPDPDPQSHLWALNQLRANAPTPGAVMIVGALEAPDGTVAEWQEAVPAEHLFALDWEQLAESISALAHPARLRIVRLVLDGTDTAKKLTGLDDMGSAGQVYHHLRHLTSTGWLRSRGGTYHVPPERMVPLLSIILSAAR